MQVQPKHSAVCIVNPVSPIVLDQEEKNELNLVTEVFLVNYFFEGQNNNKIKMKLVPYVVKKVMAIVHRCFQDLDGESSFSHMNESTLCLRLDECQFLRQVFAKIFKIATSFFNQYSKKGESSLLGKKESSLLDNDIFNKDDEEVKPHVNILFKWSPDNKFLYVDTARKFPAPLSLGKAHELFIQTEYKYYKGQTNQDFIFMVEGQVIPVHKHRLANHSKYFAKLFENGFKEAKTCKANIPQYRFLIVDEMLTFIYTGHLRQQFVSSIVDLMELTELAHMYQVKSLVNVCEAELSVHAKDHFEKVFEIALRLDLKGLINYCFELGECKKEYLLMIPKHVTRDNFAKLYTIAFESKFSVIQRELDNCRKYNPVLTEKAIEIENEALSLGLEFTTL